MAVKHPGGRVASEGGRGQRFKRDLSAPELTLLTIGGVMGSGLFLASGMAIRNAGPAVIGVFALGLAAMYLETSALGEMSAATPTPGSFLVYAHDVLGPGYTFVAGWIYWLSSVLTMSSEVTAAALFMRHWFPAEPIWIWSLVFSAGIVGLNFLSVRGFGTIEGVMAGVKVLAVLAFIALAALFLLGPQTGAAGVGAAATGASWSNLTAHGGWLPHGWAGTAPALLLVLFAYAGTGVIGMAAAETRNPATTIRQAVRGSVWLVGILYLGTALMLVTLVPWNRVPTTSSPVVAAVSVLHLPQGANVMNLVLLFAVLSTMNAALYANVRVLYTLSKERQAPPAFGRLNGRGLPANATWASAALLAVTIVLAYLLPHKAYAYLVTATGFQAMFIWLMVLLTHLRYRPYLLRHHPDRLRFRLWGFPYTTWFVMLVVLIGLAGSFTVRSELVGASVGFGGIAAAALVWLVFRRQIEANRQR